MGKLLLPPVLSLPAIINATTTVTQALEAASLKFCLRRFKSQAPDDLPSAALRSA
jgi:hypothetical protein